MGGRWEEMDGQPRHKLASLAAFDLPATPGVFALYGSDGDRLYVERAPSIRFRLWGSDPYGRPGEPDSVLTRKLVDRLGVDASKLAEHLDKGRVAWVETDSGASARRLEAEMIGEFDPRSG